MKRIVVGWVVAALVVLLHGCGGGGGSGDSGGTAAGASTTITAHGGTVATAEGVKVDVPAGAASAPVTIRIAKDSTGAPALPTTGLRLAGDVIAITPHGQNFTADVTVAIPVPKVTLADNEQLVLAKAEFGGQGWTILPSESADGLLRAKVRSFSLFAPMILSYPLSLTQRPALSLSLDSVTCDGIPCATFSNTQSSGFAPIHVQITFSTNGGQLPSTCSSTDPTGVFAYAGVGFSFPATLSYAPYPSIGSQGFGRAQGHLSLVAGQYTAAFDMAPLGQLAAGVTMQCGALVGYIVPGIFVPGLTVEQHFGPWPAPENRYSDGIVQIFRWPRAVTALSGRPVDLPYLVWLDGLPGNTAGLSRDFETLLTWERSDNDGASWQAQGMTQLLDYSSKGIGLALSSYPSVFGYLSGANTITPTAKDDGTLWRVTACWHDARRAPDVCTTSLELRLTVVDAGAAPAFVLQPADLLVSSGQTASFSAVADAANVLPVTKWQWQTRPANSSGAWTDIAGATAATYTSGVLGTPDNGAQYRVVATNAAGSTASVIVTASVSAVAVAPSILAGPLPLGVITGSDAVFAVSASGTDALSYQWFKGGVPIDGSRNPSATSPILKLAGVTAADAGSYSVRVANAQGSVTSSAATLTVGAAVVPVVAPTIVTPPGNLAVHVGDGASFGVGASGTGPFTYQWYRGSTPIAGATQAVYTVAAVAAGDAGSYFVRVSNSAGSADSAAATLAIAALGAPPAPLAFTVQPATVTTLPLAPVVLAGAASGGSGTLRYQWLFGGSPVSDGGAYSGATTPVLNITNVTLNELGTYQLVVTDAASNSITSTGATLFVVGAPSFQIGGQPLDVTVTDGGTATLTAGVDGSFVNYLWLKNGEPILNALGPAYQTPVLRVADSGTQYRLLAYNQAGIVFSRIVTVTVSPAGTVQTVASGLGSLTGLAVSSQGTAFSLDRNAFRVLAVAPNGSSSVLAGSGSAGGADGQGTSASFVGSLGVAMAIDGSDNLFVTQNEFDPTVIPPTSACTGSFAVRRITPGGNVSTIRSCQAANAVAVNVDASKVYFAGPVRYENHAPAFNIGRLDKLPGGLSTGWQFPVPAWVTGGQNQQGFQDGAGNGAQFQDVTALGLDPAGNFLVAADKGNCALRKIVSLIAAPPVTSTLAGLPTDCRSLDGALSAARFASPTGIAMVSSTFFYVADGNLIRAVDLAAGAGAGTVTTIAGTGTNATGSAAGVGFPNGIGGIAWFPGTATAPAGLYIASGDKILVLAP